MSISRRQFVEGLALGGGMLAGARGSISPDTVSATQAVNTTASHIGNLYEFVQKQADRSPLELSFLQSRFTDLKGWQPGARAKVVSAVEAVKFGIQAARKEDRWRQHACVFINASELYPCSIRGY